MVDRYGHRTVSLSEPINMRVDFIPKKNGGYVRYRDYDRLRAEVREAFAAGFRAGQDNQYSDAIERHWLEYQALSKGGSGNG